MEYCKRCCYPKNTKPMIIFDEQGVCSGCRYIEKRPSIDYTKREKILRDMLAEYKAEAKRRGNAYDCIIPVSGGKDSHFQTHLMKNVYGMNPLLVAYNHCFNTARGDRNLENMVKKFECDLLRFTTNPGSVRKIARYMIKKIGDITWHYHAGIMTFPIKAAVQYNIPLIVWGEQGYADMFGMYRHEDMLEFSKKIRQEHDMRGFEPEDILRDPDNKELTQGDLAGFYYPSEEDIERVGVRGIYLSNFIEWNARSQTEMIIEKFGFETAAKKERSFNLYDKTDDAANDVHDYLKYLKFGYGRATDDASIEMRYGRMTREEGVDMVGKYDPVRPSSLDTFLKFLGLSEEEFIKNIEHMRDLQMWEKKGEVWQVKDSIVNHKNEPGVQEARVPQSSERTRFVLNDRREAYIQELADIESGKSFAIL